MKNISKDKVVQQVSEYLDGKIEEIRSTIEDLNLSLESETKSSMGDKYETGRNMIHAELENYNSRLTILNEQKKVINELGFDNLEGKIDLGSLVETNSGYYFLSIGLGKMDLSEASVFCISLNAPIGQAMNGLKPGAEFVFHSKTIRIINVN